MTGYLPPSALDTANGDLLVPGTIAYSPAATCWFLVASPDEGRPISLSLSGESAMEFIAARIRDDASVVRLVDSRLEIDPSSGVEGRFESAPAGFAFMSGGRSGFFGQRSGGRGPAVAFDLSGSTQPIPRSSYTVFFSRWRIVAGEQRDPFVVCAHDLTRAPA